jgi:alpha-beta hydrolase superfamily lysophospholipase
MKFRRIIRRVLTGNLITVCIAGLAIAFGGPSEPKPMGSINDPFSSVDFSDMPQTVKFSARDGAKLAYRHYPGDREHFMGSVVLIHGSSASSSSMHPMAKTFAKNGYDVFALDMRGHGDSLPKGKIAYIGQLEDDVEDFLRAVALKGPKTLIGFSSGGGFALRFAGSKRQKMFDNYLLLSPYLHHKAPTFRPGSGGWVTVGLPRIIALSTLNRIGITAFNDLPVIKFALDEKSKSILTPEYSFDLWSNFRPYDDYQANIRAAHQPMEIMAGENDEVFYSKQYLPTFVAAGNPVPVTLLPKLGHIPMTLDLTAISGEIAAVDRMDRNVRPEIYK